MLIEQETSAICIWCYPFFLFARSEASDANIAKFG